NSGFERGRDGSRRTLGRMLGSPKTVFASFAVIVVLVIVLLRVVPTGFLPAEDKGFFLVSIELPGGASRQRTDAVVARVENYLLKQPGVMHAAALVGTSFLQNASQPSSATIYIRL